MAIPKQLEEKLGMLKDISSQSLDGFMLKLERDAEYVDKEITNLQDRLRVIGPHLLVRCDRIENQLKSSLARVRRLLHDPNGDREKLLNAESVLVSQQYILPHLKIMFLQAYNQLMKDLAVCLQVSEPLSIILPSIPRKEGDKKGLLFDLVSQILSKLLSGTILGAALSLHKIVQAIRKYLKTKTSFIKNIEKVKELIAFSWFIDFCKDEGLNRIRNLIEKREAEVKYIDKTLDEIEDIHFSLMEKITSN